MWMSATLLSLTANTEAGSASHGRVGRMNARNPLMNTYKTRDGRWIWLAVIQPDPKWTSFCQHIGRPDLLEDSRFSDFQGRMTSATELICILDEVFASRTLEQWKDVLGTFEGVWDPLQTPEELLRDPQVKANHFMAKGEEPGPPLHAVSSPVQFDEEPLRTVPRAPEYGQHTEEVLLEFGCDWEEIASLKEQGSII
jgi:crotonobetainyl-CoA:carnitine CoA-transferase CaiB-like acyl-CoA transferase